MAAPFLSYHAAMAGLANMGAAISPSETSFLLICTSPHDISDGNDCGERHHQVLIYINLVPEYGG